MNYYLIPLKNIPHAARASERVARRSYSSRAEALSAAEYRIVAAPGCHGRPYFDPPVVGWVCTRAAADSLAAQLTHMPDGTSHTRLAVEVVS